MILIKTTFNFGRGIFSTRQFDHKFLFFFFGGGGVNFGRKKNNARPVTGYVGGCHFRYVPSSPDLEYCPPKAYYPCSPKPPQAKNFWSPPPPPSENSSPQCFAFPPVPPPPRKKKPQAF